jgi:hypothetical protein
MIEALIEDLKNKKIEEINQIDTKLSKLSALQTKLRNCLT